MHTPSPFVEEFPEDDGEAARAALPDHIYMDAMGFGMGNCCLQVLKELSELHSIFQPFLFCSDVTCDGDSCNK